MDITSLKNTYFLMRHGHSKANEAGLIISDPKTGTTLYGLTGKGINQVNESVRHTEELTKGTIIYCSDFTRTKETAEIVRNELNCQTVKITTKLRERFFGDFEGKNHQHYEDVWKNDRIDDNNNVANVESPAAVAARTSELIKELENRHTGQTILLVSHGDCLQILQTVFLGVPPRDHRSLPHLGTAEIRKITTTPSPPERGLRGEVI